VAVGEQSVRESAKGAETIMPLTETPVVPVFVTQTALSALVVPRVTEPKATLESGREKEPLSTVTLTEAAVAVLPAASRATALRV
jgi:hypothetical protein